MGEVIGQILGTAVGVAISPVPVIAVILMLFSRKAASNSVSFAVGWVLGLSVVGAIVLALGIADDNSGEPSATSGWIKVVVGVLFIVLGVRQWRSRPRQGEEAPTPAWMASIDDFTAVRAFGIAVLLSAANPKNLGLTIAAASTIGAGGLSTGNEYVALVVFVAIASIAVVTPVVINAVAGERARPVLDEMKQWLIDYNATIMTVVLVVLGAKVLGDGITILS
ncbi:MAG: GAP family protein [Ilumatobacteraceae bacterium]|nr:GAP family protein [Ilumatobacteraceae bacterium]